MCIVACVAVAAQDAARRGADQVEESAVGRAEAAVCAERELDPRGSVPIDVMQAHPSLPARNPDVVAGALRAERLLPAAKQLAAESLSALMAENGVASASRRAALARIDQVQRIKLDVPLRDNASIVYGDPRAIRFGTIFLASLRSDEGMVSVMAHELTHAADGARGTLAPLFRRVARRAEADAGLRQVTARRGEELTCDLVGVMAARLFVARNASDEPLPRRAARAVEHNCVERDETDAAHLSPRETMRAILSLTPALAAEVTGEADAEPSAPLNHTEPRAARHELKAGAAREPSRGRGVAPRRKASTRRPPAAPR
ncbi:MAG: hypothetical protein ACJ741_07815 [Pyrinomonadaceae bacterium]